MKNRNEQDNLNVLRAVHKSPKNSQRELADKLGFSLGKINYCLKALKEKGFIKIKNFQNQKLISPLGFLYLTREHLIKLFS